MHTAVQTRAAEEHYEGLRRITLSATSLDETGKTLVVQLIEHMRTAQTQAGR